MPNHVARRCVVHGQVQGVFFRAHVQQEAERRGVRGWAANLPDGSVEVHAEGDPEAVEAVMEACRTGPRGARIDRVDVRDAEPEGARGFTRR
jgi:acylphosphatase